MLKDEILSYLKELTQELDLSAEPGDKYTAEAIAFRFRVKRNTVSHYLNQELGDTVLKINTRPVLFFHRAEFERRFGGVPRATFDSMAELTALAGKAGAAPCEDPLGHIIGASGSLQWVIEQIKASVFYPGGLPIFLSGPTGVGKSYLARQIYKYSVDQGALPEGAPFVTMNCAQYANNLELLSSNLFGHVKGAFTGAYQNEKGLLETANGGILFLDEVHRLNFENQEKLFVFLDQGMFRRMGESDVWHKSSVRLIMATTEDMGRSFLDTFLRRIPIVAHLPALRDRGSSELLQFIQFFFHQESRILNRRLCISGNVLDALCALDYAGNVGELQNQIKYICASTYARRKGSGEVEIGVQDLPDVFVKALLGREDVKARRQVALVISPDAPVEKIYDRRHSHSESYERLYQRISGFFRDVKEGGAAAEFEKKAFSAIRDTLDQLYFSEEQDSDSALMKYIIYSVQGAFRYIEHSHSVKFGGDLLHAMTIYYYYLSYPAGGGDGRRHFSRELLQFLRDRYKPELQLSKPLTDVLLSKMDMVSREEDSLVLALYLRGMEVKATETGIKSIILAHGFATASSIAGVANQLLGENVFEAMDMPLQKGVDEVAAWVKDYIAGHDVSGGLLLLVDTGSLNGIYELFAEDIKVPVAMVNNVSTHMAIAAGSHVLRKESLEQVLSALRQETHNEYRLLYPRQNKERILICCCISGVGAADQIRELLAGALPEEAGISLMSYDYRSLRDPVFLENLKKGYELLGVVGTTPLQLDLPFVSLDELLDGNAGAKLEQILMGVLDGAAIERISDGIVRSFSMKRLLSSLTILDTDKVIGHIEEGIAKYELLSGARLKNGTKVSLTIHIGCLIERLIRNMPIEAYDALDKFEQCQQNKIRMIREAFTVIEKTYSVKIPLSEIGYIYDILSKL